MKNLIVLAKSDSCAANLAGEAKLIESDYDRILYLWSNRETIVIGRFQNAYQECNLEKIREDGVDLIRRKSGGGAVYHDGGNICFTLIGDKETFNTEKSFEIVLKALKLAGFECELSGRNDILLDGKKISGNAFQTTKGKFCAHGTLLINSNLGVFGNYLTPSKTKLASKAVKSVQSRVGNLIDKDPAITKDKIIECFIKSFISTYGECEIVTEDYSTLDERFEYSSDEVVFGKTPKFSTKADRRCSFGEINAFCQIEKNVITEITLFSDCLNTSLVPQIEKELQGLDVSDSGAALSDEAMEVFQAIKDSL